MIKILSAVVVILLTTNMQAQPVKDKLRLGYNQFLAQGKQQGVTVSNDGKLIAFAYDNNVIKVISAISGRTVKRVNGVHNKFFDLRFNYDATKLISVGDKDNVAIINLESGELENRFDLPYKVTRVAVSNTEDLVAFGTLDAHVYIYDLSSYEQIQHLDAKKHHISGLDFDPKGENIVVTVMSRLRDSNPGYIYNVKTGAIVDKLPKSMYSSAEYSPDGSEIILAATEGIVAKTVVKYYNVASRSTRDAFKSVNWVSVTFYSSAEISGDYALVTSIDNAFEVIDIRSGEKVYTTKREKTKFGQTFTKVGVDKKKIYPLYDGKSYLITYSKDNINQIYNADTRNIFAYIYSDSNDDLVVAARDGRMDGSSDAIANVYWSTRKSTKAVPLEATFDQFYTPGLLSQLLSGEVAVMEDSQLEKAIDFAPLCSITSPDSITTVNSGTVKIRVNTTAQGDDIDGVKLFVNGKRIQTDTRGFVAAGEEYELTVLPGRNIISAVAVSNSGYQSAPDQVVVDYQGSVAQANLFMIAIGIDQYYNSNYNLNYATADALAFKEQVQTNSKDIFANIEVKYINDQNATKSNILAAMDEMKQRARQQDVFVFYYAGHGVMSEGSDLIPSDFYLALHDVTQLYGKDEILKAKGLSAADLREYFSTIEAQKQLIIFDACQSGAAVETFARRGAAEEKAMIQLARSAGVVLLASTGSEQYASEFEELGHGVFTYAILDGLNGSADGGTNDKKITVKELESWINDSVPELTERYKGTIQFPRSWAKGQDFPLTIVNE